MVAGGLFGFFLELGKDLVVTLTVELVEQEDNADDDTDDAGDPGEEAVDPEQDIAVLRLVGGEAERGQNSADTGSG